MIVKADEKKPANPCEGWAVFGDSLAEGTGSRNYTTLFFQERCRKKVMWLFEYWNTAESPVFIGFAGLLLKVILSNEKSNLPVSD